LTAERQRKPLEPRTPNDSEASDACERFRKLLANASTPSAA
jgi:hypothetical protein